jgi:tRNA nucleotidyltransferase (CCA-adding enzyme)
LKAFVVGGAVRDALLGLQTKDRDWVVVGATPEQMLAQGFRPVGRDFPVFLHPQTQEEYALARTERKSGHGYHGFQFDTSPEVTLEEDLRRRDLTVNAMARDDQGRIVDPYGGQADLEDRVLRHVSEAFDEDPLRILRVARFHARFAPLGFRVAEDTLAHMRAMVDSGEVDALVPERVWRETERALLESERPSVFFQTLRACGALARVMPELDALFGVPQRADYHPEVDTGIHTLMCVDVAAREGFPLAVRVAALLHDLGKALTPAEEWPRHIAHESRGIAPVTAFCERLRVPAQVRDLALLVTREHLNVHRARELRPATLCALLESLGAFRPQDPKFEWSLQACLCDAQGRLGYEHCEYPPCDYLRAAAAEALQVQARQLLAEGYSGPALGEALRQRRSERLAQWGRANAAVGPAPPPAAGA